MSAIQSALDAAGPQSARIAHLWWVFLAICGIVYALVIGFLFAALARRRPKVAASAAEAQAYATPTSEHGLTRAVATATAVTVLILFVLLVASVGTGKALSEHGEPNALYIRITGHQWWWQVTYQDPSPSQQFETANEIHIPVGRPVIFIVTSTDVIHSFWVPNLHGKIDLIPTHENTIWIRADRAGTYRGQCAEFCGLQHANMALQVIAEDPGAFEAWRRAQVEPGRTPDTPQKWHGQEVFTSLPCAMCHTVRGTAANGRTAPDLTHLATRRTLAAGILPNTRGHLAGWVLDPQGIKPGSAMPQNPMPPDDLQSLLDYMGSLQ
jgi:cytochrome c oxidase subunit 2